MKHISILIILFFILSACSANNIKISRYTSVINTPVQISKIASSESNCSVTYNSKEIWIVERHCIEKNIEKGIYIYDPTGLKKYGWYDEKFNNWAWKEGCNSINDCYYTVTIDKNGKILKFTYSFYINLSEGHYTVKIKNNDLIITDKLIYDHPS